MTDVRDRGVGCGVDAELGAGNQGTGDLTRQECQASESGPVVCDSTSLRAVSQASTASR